MTLGGLTSAIYNEVLGALMIFWALSRPVVPEPAETPGQGLGRIRRAPAT